MSYIILSLSLLIGGSGVIIAQDNARLAERTINGTARYVGMAGAMTAIGGDPSAAIDNPAGLGLYRRSELMLTADYTYDLTRQLGVTINPLKKHIMSFPQASWVVSFPTANVYEVGTQFHNLMLSYRRVHDYRRDFQALGASDASLGALLLSTGVDLEMNYCTDRYNAGSEFVLQESGSIDEYSVQWATNISNKWYVGLGAHVQSYSMSSDAIYAEKFDRYNLKNEQYYNRNATSLIFNGVTCTFSAGFIYRPTQWLRMGFSLHTASVGNISTYTSGHFTSRVDTVGVSYAPDNVWTSSDLRLPWRTSTSIAFQLGKIGMLGLQYDYAHQKGIDDRHSLRAGMEIVPIAGMYINAGYAYESTFQSQILTVPMDYTLERQDTYFMYPKSTQYASVALGFRGRYIIAQAAYQYRWQNIAIGAHENAVPYAFHTDTHRLVFTLAWHRSN